MKKNELANLAYSRRNFLQTSLLAAAGIAIGATACNNQPKEADQSTTEDDTKKENTGKSNLNIGLQLYSIPFILQKDFKGTLKKISEIGYKELEFAGPYIFSAPDTIAGWKKYAPSAGFTDSGYYGNTPQQLRGLLDENGLTSPSAHVPLNDFRKNIGPAIDAAHIVGHEYLICPFLEKDSRRSIDDYKKLAEEFNKFGETCKKGGVQFGYHNHSFEFGKLDGQVPYDVLLENTDPELVKMELDLFWATISGVDPVAIFKKQPHRFPLCHFKDLKTKMTLSDPVTSLDNKASSDSAKNAMADLGEGVIDFKSILAHADEAGLKHCIVEHDLSKDPDKTMKEGYDTLKKLLA